ncbi:MAG: ribonuclease HII [Pseudomonadota bacterium]
MKLTPTFDFEADAHSTGFHTVCGVDEAGRGPLAGPVVAAAVVLDTEAIPDGLDDSKALSERKRDDLFELIMIHATVSVATSGAALVDQMNIRAASLDAMRRAIVALETPPDLALIDGNACPPELPCQATPIVKGDSRSLSIAAASIVAKVTRDRMMVRAERLYPGYGFAKSKGYPTKAHREQLALAGPCTLHRRTYAPVKAALSNKAKT